MIEEVLYMENTPPPPEEPPDEFNDQLTVIRKPSPVVSNPALAVAMAVAAEVVREDVAAYATKPNGGNGSAAATRVGDIHAEPATAPRATTQTYSAPRHLKIFFQRTTDQDEDVRRMRELLGLLRSRPGRDRFTFFVPNPQGTVQLDFPNFTTSYAAVQEPLDEMVGQWGSIEVE